jgi:hypothetical protein
MDIQQKKRSELVIPARVVIGVTGHRKLENESWAVEEVHRVIERIKQLIPPLKNTPIVLCVLSALAEGADRLVVREVLKADGSQLEVIFPLEKEDYLKDFELLESKTEFEGFLSRARRIKRLHTQTSRPEIYAQVGRYVVDHCDVLIALWNGKPSAGQGGSAEIVHYARKKKCPLFWINTGKGAPVTFEQGRGLNRRAFKDLDRYNSERVDPRRNEKKVDDHYRCLLGHAERSSFSSENLDAICKKILPHYIQADILSQRFQNLYYKAGSLVYALAAAAISVAAFQALFLSNWPRIVIIELAFIVTVFIIFWLGSRQRWHSKWIDYRFLAERFRSAVFMALANVNVTVLSPPRHLSLSYSSQDWMVVAFFSVWSQLPRLPDPDSSGFKGLKKFLLVAWIDDQIRYHKDKSKRHQRRYRRMYIAGYILFGFTFVAALLHVLQVGPDLFHRLSAFMAIVFPAIAGALGAIRIQREYLRNAKRSTEMVRHLEEIKEQMRTAQNLESFLPLVCEVEDTMLHENEDWRVVVRFHELEPAA